MEKVFREYWDENEPRLKLRSKPEYQRALDHFISFAGKATNIEEVDADVLRRYKQKLLKEEIRSGKTRSIKTINDKYLTLVKGFLNYAKHHGYITENPADGLIIPERDSKRRDEKREAFSIEDLRKMFCDSSEFGQDKIEQPYQFWMPLIGLHTGMRIEEICQLYVSDLKKFDGIWCLDINQDGKDKSVKTSERRIVPLHSFLTEDLNFVGYVKSLSDQQGRIFPELKRIKNRYSHYASRWFSKFVKGCEIVADLNTKVFHSFRHTVTDHLFKKDAPERVISMLVGHAIKGETGGRYGKRYEPKLLYEKTVMRLDYGIDLNHLKNSKFVVR